MNPPAAALDPDAVVAATLACPSVAAMSGGVLGEVATYLPGRRIHGIRSTPDGVEVHVVGAFGPSMSQIAAQIRSAVQPLLAGQQLSIHIDDLAVDVQGPVPPVPTPRQPPPGGPPLKGSRSA